MNKFTYTYGFLEARVWLPGSGAIGDWPGVWADGANWPQDGELDVLEGLNGQACYHFHYGTSPSDNNGPGGCVATDYTRGWHTFGADWEPGVVTWYYDGVAVGTLTTGVTSAPMYIILDLAESATYGGPLVSPGALRIDDIRVWQHPSTP
jgi:beta-glucanase (GH16 family)